MTPDQYIAQAEANFQQFCVVEMILQWVIGSPPGLENELLRAWRERQSAIYDAAAKANFERTGIIATDRSDFDKALDAAERNIRQRFAMARAEREKDETTSRATLERIMELAGGDSQTNLPKPPVYVLLRTDEDGASFVQGVTTRADVAEAWTRIDGTTNDRCFHFFNIETHNLDDWSALKLSQPNKSKRAFNEFIQCIADGGHS